MRKLTLTELGRMSLEQHQQASKLPIVVVLDNLRSQHNIGSIFRTADAFRLEAVYLCGITAKPPNREMNKTALGATESVDWKYFSTTVEAVSTLKERKYTLIGVEQTTLSIPLGSFKLPATEGIALIFGNEVSGIEQEVLDMVETCIEIPQYGTKHSLNVSVSAGIVIWDVFTKLLDHMGLTM